MTRAFSYVGTVSYGMYLWHWLAYEVIASTGVRVHLPIPGLLDWALGTALVAIATLPLAIVSWHIVEKPAIRWARGRRLPQPPVVAAAA